jgi:hypothetical protein
MDPAAAGCGAALCSAPVIPVVSGFRQTEQNDNAAKVPVGRRRQAGAQNEAYFHCHWGDDRAPGVFNEWLVALPGAFCWNTAEWMRRNRRTNG